MFYMSVFLCGYFSICYCIIKLTSWVLLQSKLTNVAFVPRDLVLPCTWRFPSLWEEQHSPVPAALLHVTRAAAQRFQNLPLSSVHTAVCLHSSWGQRCHAAPCLVPDGCALAPADPRAELLTKHASAFSSKTNKASQLFLAQQGSNFWFIFTVLLYCSACLCILYLCILIFCMKSR